MEQELPNWNIYSKDNNPSHGEYIILLKQEENDYPYIALAHYTYQDGGKWFFYDDERKLQYITKQVYAWQEPRFAHNCIMEGDR